MAHPSRGYRTAYRRGAKARSPPDRPENGLSAHLVYPGVSLTLQQRLTRLHQDWLRRCSSVSELGETTRRLSGPLESFERLSTLDASGPVRTTSTRMTLRTLPVCSAAAAARRRLPHVDVTNMTRFLIFSVDIHFLTYPLGSPSVPTWPSRSRPRGLDPPSLQSVDRCPSVIYFVLSIYTSLQSFYTFFLPLFFTSAPPIAPSEFRSETLQPSCLFFCAD